jgi:ribosomal-protein-alanine N-acetyltransferase
VPDPIEPDSVAPGPVSSGPVSSGPESIVTERLILEPLHPETLEAFLARDHAAGERAQGRTLPKGFLSPAEDAFLKIQLHRMATRPDGQGWCARAIIRAADDAVMGHCGFHGPPEDVGRAEVGYTVFPDYRRQGYAVEAVAGLVDYARSQGQPVVFACVSPDNVASLAVVARLGFRQTGVQGDEVDGQEGVFELTF